MGVRVLAAGLGAAGLSAVMLLAGATPATAQSAPLTTDPHSAASALARATTLAESFPLPSGVVWITKVTQHPKLAGATQTVVVSRLARGRHLGYALLPFFRTHPVPGMVVTAAEQLYPTLYEVGYGTKATTFTSAELSYAASGSEVGLELDITVGWAPARPADTVIPASLKAVTVEVWPPQAFTARTVPAFPHQVIRTTGPAVSSLIRYLDGLRAQGPFPFGAGACTVPLFYGSTPRITFHTPGHVVVFQYVSNCQTFNVSVDGKHRPTLAASYLPYDPTKLLMTNLLHLVP